MRSLKKSENMRQARTHRREAKVRLISSEDLLRRLTEARDKYKDSDDLIDKAISVGLDRALTEVVLSPTEGRK